MSRKKGFGLGSSVIWVIIRVKLEKRRQKGMPLESGDDSVSNFEFGLKKGEEEKNGSLIVRFYVIALFFHVMDASIVSELWF